jgi:hypothetical protein
VERDAGLVELFTQKGREPGDPLVLAAARLGHLRAQVARRLEQEGSAPGIGDELRHQQPLLVLFVEAVGPREAGRRGSVAALETPCVAVWRGRQARGFVL